VLATRARGRRSVGSVCRAFGVKVRRVSRWSLLTTVVRPTVPDANLAGMSRRSRNSTRPDRYWIITLDGIRLQEARMERGLSRGKLAGFGDVEEILAAYAASQS